MHRARRAKYIWSFILILMVCIDVFFYRKWLGRYRLEHILAKTCPIEKELGLILVDSQDMKMELLPSPLKCLDILYEILPNKAKTIMDRLIQIAQDAVIKLEGEPVTTMDFVNVLRYNNDILYCSRSG